MKKITYILGAVLFAGTLASCDLDSMSLTEKDTSNFPVNAGDAAQALAGIYNLFEAAFAGQQRRECQSAGDMALLRTPRQRRPVRWRRYQRQADAGNGPHPEL